VRRSGAANPGQNFLLDSHYRPARPEQTVIASMVREFVGRVFDGAPKPLLLHLVEDGHLDEDERRELLRLINDIRK
jgi:predicted transcriptional regulator